MNDTLDPVRTKERASTGLVLDHVLGLHGVLTGVPRIPAVEGSR